MPTKVAVPLAIHVGKRMPAASLEPRDARSPITPVGSMARPAVLMARKRTIALLAVPFSLFRVSSCSIARIPNGVAALPSPSMFADMLRIIALMAGWSGGIPGKRRFITGPRALAKRRIRPPSSATRIKPKKNAMTPTRPIASVTASRAESIRA